MSNNNGQFRHSHFLRVLLPLSHTRSILVYTQNLCCVNGCSCVFRRHSGGNHSPDWLLLLKYGNDIDYHYNLDLHRQMGVSTVYMYIHTYIYRSMAIMDIFTVIIISLSFILYSIPQFFLFRSRFLSVYFAHLLQFVILTHSICYCLSATHLVPVCWASPICNFFFSSHAHSFLLKETCSIFIHIYLNCIPSFFHRWILLHI